MTTHSRNYKKVDRWILFSLSVQWIDGYPLRKCITKHFFLKLNVENVHFTNFQIKYHKLYFKHIKTYYQYHNIMYNQIGSSLLLAIFGFGIGFSIKFAITEGLDFSLNI